LDFFIGRCVAPCSGACSQEEYAEVIREVILFLEGRTENVLRALRAQMVIIRRICSTSAPPSCDQVRAIENVSRPRLRLTRPTDEDVFGLARSDGDAEVQVLFIRGTKMIGGDHFPLDGAKGESDAEVVDGFLKQFYESATYVPLTVLLPLEVPERSEIETWLSEKRGSRVTLLTPKRGAKRRLIEMATDNAREAMGGRPTEVANRYGQDAAGARRASRRS
jgi:excinuclease ABC subunit C